MDRELNGEYLLAIVEEVMLEVFRWVIRRSRHKPIGSGNGEREVLGEVQVVRERNVIVERRRMRNRFLCGRIECLCIFVFIYFLNRERLV